MEMVDEIIYYLMIQGFSTYEAEKYVHRLLYYGELEEFYKIITFNKL